MRKRSHFRGRRWNIVRKRLLGERFLRAAGVADINAAWDLLRDSRAEQRRRSIAVRAIGLLGDNTLGALWDADPRDGSALSAAVARAGRDADRRRWAEYAARDRESAVKAMGDLGVTSPGELLSILCDRGAAFDRRATAAQALGGLQCREAVDALINALAEGNASLSYHASFSLNQIDSRRGARRLLRIAGTSPLEEARFWAIYSIWMLHETRGADVLIRIGGDLANEAERTRSAAVEALGNSVTKKQTQKALVRHLSDPSIDVRYSALCALSLLCGDVPEFVREALTAKLDDPARLDDHRVVADLARQILSSGTTNASPSRRVSPAEPHPSTAAPP